MFDIVTIFRKALTAAKALGKAQQLEAIIMARVQLDSDWSAREVILDALRDSTIGLECVAEEILYQERQRAFLMLI